MNGPPDRMDGDRVCYGTRIIMIVIIIMIPEQEPESRMQQKAGPFVLLFREWPMNGTKDLLHVTHPAAGPTGGSSNNSRYDRSMLMKRSGRVTQSHVLISIDQKDSSAAKGKE